MSHNIIQSFFDKAITVFATIGSFIFWFAPQRFVIYAKIDNNLPHSFSILDNAFQKIAKYLQQMDGLIFGHCNVALNGMLERPDIIWHNRVTTRCANEAHDVGK